MGIRINNQIDSRPYKELGTTNPSFYICEVCPGEPKIGSKEWSSHSRGKKHVQYKAEVEAKEKAEKDIAEGRLPAPPADNLDSSNGAADAWAAASADTLAATGSWGDSAVAADGAWGGDTGATASANWADDAAPAGNKDDGWTSTRSGGYSNMRSSNTNNNYPVGSGCHACGEDGHFARECPNKPSRSMQCYKCNEDGHMARECPSAGSGGARTCFRCGEEGHMKSECPNSGRGSGGGSQACFKCGEEGHRKSECPNAASGGGGDRLCYNCNQPGHESRDCTEPRKEGRAGGGGGGGSRGCYKCGLTGHIARDCGGGLDQGDNGGFKSGRGGGSVLPDGWASTAQADADADAAAALANEWATSNAIDAAGGW